MPTVEATEETEPDAFASPRRWAVLSLGFQPVATAKMRTEDMSTQEIETAITNLPHEEFWELMGRLDQLQEEKWDQRIARDAEAGRFDALIEQAKKDSSEGRCTPL